MIYITCNYICWGALCPIKILQLLCLPSNYVQLDHISHKNTQDYSKLFIVFQLGVDAYLIITFINISS